MNSFIKEREFGEIFKETFVFFKKKIKPLVTIILAFVGPFILYSVYFMFKHQAEMESDINIILKTQDFSNIASKYYSFILFALVQQLVLIVVVASYIKLKVKDELEYIGISNIWEEIKTSFINVALGQILVISTIFLGMFLTVLTSFNGFIFLLVLAWAVYISVALYVLSFVIIYEKLTAIDAIKRTLQLVKGNWGFTFGSIIVFGIVVGSANMIISSMIKNIIQIISTGAGAEIIVLILSSIVSVILSALSIILTSYLYAQYVAKKHISNL